MSNLLPASLPVVVSAQLQRSAAAVNASFPPRSHFSAPELFCQAQKVVICTESFCEPTKPLSTNSLPFFFLSFFNHIRSTQTRATSCLSRVASTSTPRWPASTGSAWRRSYYRCPMTKRRRRSRREERLRGSDLLAAELEEFSWKSVKAFHVLDQVFSRTWRLGRSC